jgi:hypothetical protein
MKTFRRKKSLPLEQKKESTMEIADLPKKAMMSGRFKKFFKAGEGNQAWLKFNGLSLSYRQGSWKLILLLDMEEVGLVDTTCTHTLEENDSITIAPIPDSMKGRYKVTLF